MGLSNDNVVCNTPETNSTKQRDNALMERDKLVQELDLVTNEIDNHRDELAQERDKQADLRILLDKKAKEIEHSRTELRRLLSTGVPHCEYLKLSDEETAAKQSLCDIEEQVDQSQQFLERMEQHESEIEDKDAKIKELQDQLWQVEQELERINHA